MNIFLRKLPRLKDFRQNVYKIDFLAFLLSFQTYKRPNVAILPSGRLCEYWCSLFFMHKICFKQYRNPFKEEGLQMIFMFSSSILSDFPLCSRERSAEPAMRNCKLFASSFGINVTSPLKILPSLPLL